jgi:hypothetical protein
LRYQAQKIHKYNRLLTYPGGTRNAVSPLLYNIWGKTIEEDSYEKKLFFAGMAALALTFVVVLTGCPTGNDDDDTYMVSYDANGGTGMVSAKRGPSSLYAPYSPSRLIYSSIPPCSCGRTGGSLWLNLFP